MPDRYHSESPLALAVVTLGGAEAHHLLHVMRVKVGQEVLLFDGGGAEFLARIERLARSSVELMVLERREVDRELAAPLILGVALPKGDRQRWLVEKAVELGVTRIVPLTTTRAVAQPEEQALERLRRAVIEASKQCGRNRLMHIASPLRCDDFFAQAPSSADRWIAHPDCERLAGGVAPPNDWRPADRASGVYVGIGPEGGFTDEELSLALAAGWRQADLGRRILRVETAALYLAAIFGEALAK